MIRPLRIIVPNIPFHVLDRGNNRQIVFRENEDFAYFLKLLKKYKKGLTPFFDPIFERRVAVPTNKEERVSDACELVSRRVTD